jgi:hypothetical protein
MKYQKLTSAFIMLVVGFYLLTIFVPMMHFHKDSIDETKCAVCYYYLNHQLQDLPCQCSVYEFESIQIFSVATSVGFTSKVILLYDSSRAPPRLSLI